MKRQLTLSKKAIVDLIIQPEISSREYYERRLRKPIWPGGHSGITIGLGYDVGMVTAQKVAEDWAGVLPLDSVQQLQKVAGKAGQECKVYLGMNVDVPWDIALAVFYKTSLVDHARRAAKTYPELEELHPYEQTAIVGLVYNRGNGINGERRNEMRELVQAIKDDNDNLMAGLIRNMKRLWNNTQRGLLIRRELEADYIERDDSIMLPEEDKLFITV